jgi:beta-galactosidase/beta-glucuronidase
MGRVVAIAVSISVLVAVGLGAQQPASLVAGKWDVTVDRQTTRTVQLTVDGTAVAGTLTKAGSTATAEVTGVFKKVELTFWTPEKPEPEEFFGVVVRDGVAQGTYVHCVNGVCTKSAVTMKRAAKTN